MILLLHHLLREAEVAEQKGAILIDENIRRLEVSVDVSLRMNELQSL
jgi:hypothetical protein